MQMDFFKTINHQPLVRSLQTWQNQKGRPPHRERGPGAHAASLGPCPVAQHLKPESGAQSRGTALPHGQLARASPTVPTGLPPARPLTAPVPSLSHGQVTGTQRVCGQDSKTRSGHSGEHVSSTREHSALSGCGMI